MSDRYPASIRVGGALDLETLKGLHQAVEDCHAGLEFGYKVPSFDELVEAAASCAADGEPLRFHDEEASYGTMEPIERFCEDAALPYCRYSDGYFETSPMIEWWKPGMQNPDTHLMHAHHGATIPVDDILDAIEKADEAEAALEAVRAMAARHKEAEIPAVELQLTFEQATELLTSESRAVRQAAILALGEDAPAEKTRPIPPNEIPGTGIRIG